ncbi:MAG: hypothetical protein ACR2PL_13750 [Dehalococcoidia bacterium]
MSGEGLSQEAAVVVGEHLSIAVAEQAQKLRRALDIGEEQGDGAGREIWHGVSLHESDNVLAVRNSANVSI